MQPWVPIPIDAKLFQNVDPNVLPKGTLALENAFINDAGGHSRFPGLSPFCQLPDPGRVYVGLDWRGDMLAGTSGGRVFRVAKDKSFTDVTGASVEGGNRVIFTKTEDRAVMAAGGPIVMFDGTKTRILSDKAPLASHVAFIDSFLVASEIASGRFHYSDSGTYDSWQALSELSADSKPDDINALLVTPFREILVPGVDSLEQWERLLTGAVPFFRRWSTGEGVKAPYTLMAADNAAWCINRDKEFIRLASQAATPESVDIQMALDNVDDWSEAWVGGHPDRELAIDGQRLLILGLPNASNPYGTKGLTYGYDLKQKRWLSLYGWDAGLGLPTRWPGWSYCPMWDRVIVGGDAGQIYLLDGTVHNNAGQVQRMLGRTAHMSQQGEIRVDAVRMRLNRGLGGNTPAPIFRLRCNRDNGRWSRWQERSVGKAGDGFFYVHYDSFGDGTSFMFEWECTDDCNLQIVSLEAQVTPLGI